MSSSFCKGRMGENEFSAEEREVFREDETNSFWWIGFEAANTSEDC